MEKNGMRKRQSKQENQSPELKDSSEWAYMTSILAQSVQKRISETSNELQRGDLRGGLL
jgi:hypothetical protein